MDFLLLGFITGLSLILAIGAQNIFVIEQGLKNQYVFTICMLCSLSDALLIFLGIFIFYLFGKWIDTTVYLLLNLLLIGFLVHFIITKYYQKIDINTFEKTTYGSSYLATIYKTLAFTYLNPHVYSDTVFILGNLSKNFTWQEKFSYATGASLASLLFFFLLGYAARFFSAYLKNNQTWHYIDYIIILIMSSILAVILWDTYIVIADILQR